MMNLLAGVAFLAFAQTNDKVQANAYDDAWETQWIAHCRAIFNAGTNKTAGFVLQLGDSITHSSPYCQWPRSGMGNMSTEDWNLVTWIKADLAYYPGTQNDTTSKNGFYLAVADTSGNRGMTAGSGLDANEFLNGSGNGAVAMPSDTVQASAATKVADGATYPDNLHHTTVAAAFGDAPFAVLMLGTNDVNWMGRTPAAFATDLTSIVNTLEAKNIVVILSTVPPMRAPKDVTPFNTEIRNFAQSRGLPLIDFYMEVLARRPGTTWDGTLIGADGIHPTATDGTYDSSSNPYQAGGSSLTHTTGAPAANVGYLLRSWLTIQKLKEVQSYIANGVNPAPPPPVVPPVTNGGAGNGSGDHKRCGCGTSMPGGFWGALGAAAFALAIASIRRA
jgi:GDSL-like lipase/acylhydrolase family protein